MKENYCALALAVMAPTFLLPEDAFRALDEGKVCRTNRKWDDIVPAMIAMHDDGSSWREVAETFGYSKQNAMCMVSRYKKRKN